MFHVKQLITQEIVSLTYMMISRFTFLRIPIVIKFEKEKGGVVRAIPLCLSEQMSSF